MAKRWFAATLSIAVLFGVGACSNEKTHATSQANSPVADSGRADPSAALVAHLRDTSSARYEPFETPKDMLSDADVAIMGEVVSVELAMIRNEFDGQGGVVVGVRPLEVWKEAKGEPAELTYFVVRRAKNVGVEPFRAGLPVGHNVAIFGYTSDVQFIEGDPGQPILEPAPQGLFIETDAGLANVYAPGDDGWPEIKTMKDLAASIL